MVYKIIKFDRCEITGKQTSQKLNFVENKMNSIEMQVKKYMLM